MKNLSKYLIFGGVLYVLGIFGIFRITAETQNVVSIREDVGNVGIENKNIEFDLVAGGDVMMSRHAGTKIRESGDNALPFRKIADIFSQADIAFVNLESPFYNQGDYVTEGMVFKTEPEYIDGLKLAGIDMVSLANNHLRNRGRVGLQYTFDYLEQNDIKYSGAGNNYSEAHQPQIIEIEDLKIAFLSYTYSDGNGFTSSVERDDSDVAFMELDQMSEDVKFAKGNADVVIVSMHAGVEYKNYPNDQQEEFARTAIDSGAELVLGHHPHVVQSTESYNGGYIIYSMGNLVFDQMWSEETREGVIAKCKFVNSEVKDIEFLPVKIENFSQPRLATEAESVNILERMGLEDSKIQI